MNEFSRISLQASSENGELRSNEQLESSLEERIEELRHRLRIEAAVVDGAKNVIRTLQSNKTIDKKALQEVSTRFLLFSLRRSHNFALTRHVSEQTKIKYPRKIFHRTAADSKEIALKIVLTIAAR